MRTPEADFSLKSAGRFAAMNERTSSRKARSDPDSRRSMGTAPSMAMAHPSGLRAALSRPGWAGLAHALFARALPHPADLGVGLGPEVEPRRLAARGVDDEERVVLPDMLHELVADRARRAVGVQQPYQLIETVVVAHL